MRIINIEKFLLLVFISSLYSVFSSRDVYDIKQPDGYTFDVIMYGSEYYNYIKTVAGYTVVSMKLDGELWWYYAIKDNGKLRPSDILVSNKNMPPEYSYNLKPDYTKHNILNEHSSNRYINSSREKTIKPLVILVDFSDNTPVHNHQYTKEDFSELFFGQNPSSPNIPDSYQISVKDYYEEVSDGEITIDGDSESIVDWVTMPESYSYYVDGNQGLGMGEGGLERSAKATLVHAMGLIDVDMDEFDGNNDGVCDVVIMIMEGSDSGSLNEFWSYKGALGYGEANTINSSSPTVNDELTYDNIIIRNFIVTTETIYHSSGSNYTSGDIRPIGTICHEIGHVLGLPDLYDTSESSAPGIGDWGLMGTGNWNNQVSPSSFCSWSASKLGIIDIESLDNLLDSEIDIEPVHLSQTAYKLNIGLEETGEYILLENRAITGTDSYLKAEGLLLWHIDERLTSTAPMYNEVNINKDFYGVRLLEAGGTNHLSTENSLIYSSESHIFDGFNEIFLINDYTIPSLKGNSYDRDSDSNIENSIESGLEIRDISMSGNTINLFITAPEIMGDRIFYNETGVQGFSDGYVGSLDTYYIPGIKYSAQNDEYLKIIQTPIIYTFGSIDDIEIKIYNLGEPSGNGMYSILSDSLIYNDSQSISWGCDREYGIIDFYIDDLYLTNHQNYFIQIDYQGNGAIIPLEFSFFKDIDASGKSYMNINNQAFPVSNADFAITLITSLDSNYNDDDSYSDCIEPQYPYPNPTNNEIVIPNSDNLLGDIQIKVYDLLGKLIIEKNISSSIVLDEFRIYMNNLPTGIYLILLSDQNEVQKKYKISIIN